MFSLFFPLIPPLSSDYIIKRLFSLPLRLRDAPIALPLFFPPFFLFLAHHVCYSPSEGGWRDAHGFRVAPFFQEAVRYLPFPRRPPSLSHSLEVVLLLLLPSGSALSVPVNDLILLICIIHPPTHPDFPLCEESECVCSLSDPRSVPKGVRGGEEEREEERGGYPARPGPVEHHGRHRIIISDRPLFPHKVRSLALDFSHMRSPSSRI